LNIGEESSGSFWLVLTISGKLKDLKWKLVPNDDDRKFGVMK
jgi:hypothetical protein